MNHVGGQSCDSCRSVKAHVEEPHYCASKKKSHAYLLPCDRELNLNELVLVSTSLHQQTYGAGFDEDGENWYSSEIAEIVEKDLIVLEVCDFERAIICCKKLKRYAQKKNYEYKLRHFLESGELLGGNSDWRDIHPSRFFGDLIYNLTGKCTKIGPFERSKQVKKIIEEQFCEYKEMSAAFSIYHFCSKREEIEANYAKANEKYNLYKDQFSLISDAYHSRKSIEEIAINI